MTRWSGACVGFLLLTLTMLCALAGSPKRVLILNPFEREVAPFGAVVSAFRSTLARELGQPVDFYDVPLDLARFAELEGEDPLVAFLEGRIKSHRADLVVPIGGAGAQFATRHRERLFPDTPVLVVGGDPRLIAPEFLRTNTTLVTYKVNLSGMVEDILQLQPQTTNIVVVFGASALEKFWVSECRREFQSFTNRVGFTWLNELPLAQILKRCAALPPQSFILHGLFVMDAAGVPCEKSEALRRLHEVANAPLFGYFASEFGLGTIGGRLYQGSEVGVQGARTAIRILRGERPGSIPPQTFEAAAPVFDWRELQRWGVSEARLPAGSVVKFYEPTAWERYKWRIIAIASLFLAEALLIFALLVNLFKRRRTERSLAESEARFRIAADGAPVMMWMSGLDRRCTFFNRPWLEFTGRKLEQELGNGWVDGVHRDDVAGCLKTYAEAFEARQPFVMEYRLRRHDGEYRWISDTGRPRHDPRGSFAGYIGSCLDITERKQAEQAARELSGRLIRAQEAERARLSRELHDDITQRLARLAIDAGRVERGITEAGAREMVREVRDGLMRLSEDVHLLSYKLHPALLQDLGLADALKVECERFTRQESIPVGVKLGGIPAGLPPDTGLCLFRVTQEALRNVARHARAKTAEVSLRRLDGGLQLAVTDSGIGFDPRQPRQKFSIGLASMQERVRLLGGELDIESAPGKGTTILAWVPLKQG